MVSSENASNSCSICYETVKIRGKLSCCDHMFCYACIEQWSKDSNSCPLCKNPFRAITKVENGKTMHQVRVPKRQFHHEYDAEYYGIPEHLLYGNDDEYLDELEDLDVDENGNLLGFIDYNEADGEDSEEEGEVVDLEQEEPEIQFHDRRLNNSSFVILSDSEEEEEEEAEPEAASFLYDDSEEEGEIPAAAAEDEEESEEESRDAQLQFFYEEAEEADSEEERQMAEETERNYRRLQEDEEQTELIRPQFRRVPIHRRRSRLRTQVIDLSDEEEEEHSSQHSSTDDNIEIIPTPVYTSPIRNRLIKRKKRRLTKELEPTILDESIGSSSVESSSDAIRVDEEEEEEVEMVNNNTQKNKSKHSKVVDLSDDDTEVLDVEVIRKAVQYAKQCKHL